MGRPDAFFIPPEQFAAPYALTGGEAGHCAKVLRKRPGELVRAFDGTGRHGLFRIETVGRDRVELVPESLEESPLPARRLHVAAGFSRSARRDFFLEKAVELGAAGIVFWQAERTQGKMPGDPKEAWTAGLIAAAKQCGAARLPTLACVPGGAPGLAQAGQAYPRRFLLWEDPAVSRPLTPADLTADGDTLCVVGPEGGFSDAEAATLTATGFVPVTLGPRVLRWETAALAVLALGLTADTTERESLRRPGA